MASVLPWLHPFESDGQKNKLVGSERASSCSEVNTAAAAAGICAATPSVVFRPSLSNDLSHRNANVIARELCVFSFSLGSHLRPRGVDMIS